MTDTLKMAREALEELHYSNSTDKAEAMYRAAIAAIDAQPAQTLTDEQIDDCLPLGMSEHMTLCGPAEIRRFARAVLAAAPTAVQAQSVEQPNLACKSVQKRLATQRGYVQALTDEQIDALWKAPMSADWEHREFARATIAEFCRVNGIGAAAQGGEHE